MKANPGGVVDPRNVYGRDKLIAQLWDRLERQCILINAERRIGKTSILRKMHQEPPDGWFPILLDLEQFQSAEEFAAAIYEQVQQYLGVWKKVANKARKIYEAHDFGKFKRTAPTRPWKALITAAVEDLSQEKCDRRLVFLWDEVPYMIDRIRRANGEQAAIEVLDLLRSLRQQYADLRMIFSGSIGLHHVLESIRDGKISTEPVNDMHAVEVPPLARPDAIRLACDLIEGEHLAAADREVSASVVADEADHFPFYIHHIIDGLRQTDSAAEPDAIRALVARQLVDANDPWDLGHYRSRIPAYYRGDENAQLVGLILDALATAAGPLTVPLLQDAINARSTQFDNRDALIRVLRLMERDHYLVRTPDGQIGFRFPLIRRWWILDRGL